ncbi:MAG: hypothetical protein JRE81_13210, partial [Deltaproteobacteria bacterium]|nr:hypothetical protein [Deltaproteobacteria bacterium]
MDRSVWLERLVLVSAGSIVVVGIGSYGIWDPWELGPAFGTEIAFAFLGVSEISARLPAVVGGLITGVLAFGLLRAYVSTRAGVSAATVLASTPLFVLGSRLAMGHAPAMAAQAFVGVAAIAVSTYRYRRWQTVALYIALAASVGASTWISGVLLGPLPPLLAVALWIVVSEGDVANAPARWLFPSTATLLTVGVLGAVMRDAPEISRWLGGGAVGGNPPTWDAALEVVFHGFAPWSAALPIALAWAMWPREGRPAAVRRLASILVLWAAFGFVSWTIFASRYGTPPWLATLPLAAIVGLWLDEVSDVTTPRWAAAVTVVLLTGLLVRDYALFPQSALRPLADATLNVPDLYRPIGGWAATFSFAGLALALLLISPVRSRVPSARATLRWLHGRWQGGGPARAWIALAMSSLGVAAAFGLICFSLDLRIPSLMLRVGRYLFFAPLVIAALLFGLPWVQYLYGRLGAQRVFVALAAGLSVGAFTAWSFQPALGRHFSPKPVFETYTALTEGRDEPLASYRTRANAARYYTGTRIEEIEDQSTLLTFLRGGGQRWAVLPADELGRISRGHRRQTGRQVYVADARSARLLLVAAEPIPGRPNQSFIADAVLTSDPLAQHPIDAVFDDRVALVGYDLDLPEGDFVGAGQRFKLTWYWRVLERPPSGHKVFVHIDGDGLRLNGDHEPIDGRYPPKLWESGDIIADTQELTVPANF